MKYLKYLALPALLALFLCACAHLQPGADPIVVRTEQLETTAQASFHMALVIDNEDRGFWRTNAPAFHNWCEWLRTPTPYYAPNMFSLTNVVIPRYRVLLLSLDDVKNDYKTSRASSNALYSALITLQSAANQTASWLTIVTNKP